MLGLYPRSDLMLLRRVRMHGTRDALRARQRFERSLAAVDGVPPGISPSAVLFVRRLVPVAGGAAASQTSLGDRVSLALRRHASQARRPWLHEDAIAADAVLFADEAELVACLVRDWLRGRVADRWWWRSVLGELSPQQWLRQHVLARGEVMVPAIAVLAAGLDAAGWLARLEDTEAEEAIAAIARTHAVSLTVAHESTAQRPSERNDGHGLMDIETDRRGDSQSAALKRLIAIVPEARAPALRPPQRRLLALALALTRAPSGARTPQLALALRGLDRAGLAADTQALTTRDAAKGAPPMGDIPAGRLGSTDATDGTHVAPTESGGSLAPARRRVGLALFRARHAPHDAPPVTRTVEDAIPATQAETATAAPSPKAKSEQTPFIEGAPRARTQFGGIFYLLNAALALKLYGDFTAPRTPGLALSPWDWLALVGRAWFGEEFVRDPVWTVLAELAGRAPKDAPDRDFAAPPEWRIDTDWLAPWVECDALRIGATRTRLRVLHAAGFVVFDVARDPATRPLSQARDLCAAYDALRGLKLARTRALGSCAPARAATARWLQWLLDYLRARLASALDVDRLDDVPALLCRHPAEIARTAASVHVHLALAGLPIAVRVAGLDRDPGWVPAAGRTIRFHFD